MAISRGPHILNNGLISQIDIGNSAYTYSTPLIYDYSVWADGQVGSITPFSSYGGYHNDRIISTDPWGHEVVVWRSGLGTTDPLAELPAQGGIYGNPVSIDATKLYRISYWENRFTNGTGTYGRYYIGCNAYGSVAGIGNLTNTTPNTNPYFWYIDHSKLPINSWFLVVGHIFPYTYDSTSLHADSGRYTVADGRIGDNYYDFRWLKESTTGRPRTLAIYRGNAPDMVHYSLYPRFDVCDGNEPSIDDLLHNRPRQTINQITKERVGINVTSDVSGSLVFVNNEESVVTLGDLQDLGDNFSIGMWVKPTNFSSSYNPLISRDGNTQYNFGMGLNSSGSVIIQQHLGESIENGSCETGVWQYIVTTVDNLVCNIYLNSVQQSSSYEFTESFNDTGDMNLGVYSFTPMYFSGEINLPQIYYRALSESEILQNYNALKGRFGH